METIKKLKIKLKSKLISFIKNNKKFNIKK